MSFDQGTNDSHIQVLAINISDDQLLEGTESFVVSGHVTEPASFVPGRDMVTVDILDNDGKFELVHTQSCCLYHNCRKKGMHQWCYSWIWSYDCNGYVYTLFPNYLEAVIGFNQTAYTFEEGDGTVEVCVAFLQPRDPSQISPTIDRSIQLIGSTSSDTANG